MNAAAHQLPNTTYKTIKLMEDDLLMGFRKHDEIIVQTGKEPDAGSLVVISYQGKYLMSRLEVINGNKYLWPPRGIQTIEYDHIIIGEALELNRSLSFA